MTLEKTEQEWHDLLAAKNAEPVAFDVTRKAATERPFTGKYEDHWAPGSYHCICCDAKLFDASTKFDAGCGWPSFHTAASEEAIAEHRDTSHGMVRVETVCVQPMWRALGPCVQRRPCAHGLTLLHELGFVRLRAKQLSLL